MDAGSEVHVMSLKVVRRELLSVFGLKNRMIDQYYQHVEGGTRKAPHIHALCTLHGINRYEVGNVVRRASTTDERVNDTNVFIFCRVYRTIR